MKASKCRSSVTSTRIRRVLPFGRRTTATHRYEILIAHQKHFLVLSPHRHLIESLSGAPFQVPQAGDGYLNFTSIKREHSGWYKCTARHLNFQYTSIGYYLSVRCKLKDIPLESPAINHRISYLTHRRLRGCHL